MSEKSRSNPEKTAPSNSEEKTVQIPLHKIMLRKVIAVDIRDEDDYRYSDLGLKPVAHKTPCNPVPLYIDVDMRIYDEPWRKCIFVCPMTLYIYHSEPPKTEVFRGGIMTCKLIDSDNDEKYVLYRTTMDFDIGAGCKEMPKLIRPLPNMSTQRKTRVVFVDPTQMPKKKSSYNSSLTIKSASGSRASEKPVVRKERPASRKRETSSVTPSKRTETRIRPEDLLAQLGGNHLPISLIQPSLAPHIPQLSPGANLSGLFDHFHSSPQFPLPYIVKQNDISISGGICQPSLASVVSQMRVDQEGYLSKHPASLQSSLLPIEVNILPVTPPATPSGSLKRSLPFTKSSAAKNVKLASHSLSGGSYQPRVETPLPEAFSDQLNLFAPFSPQQPTIPSGGAYQPYLQREEPIFADFRPPSLPSIDFEIIESSGSACQVEAAPFIPQINTPSDGVHLPNPDFQLPTIYGATEQQQSQPDAQDSSFDPLMSFEEAFRNAKWSF